MEAIGRHLGPGQASGEFAGEQDIGELRAAVDLKPVVTLGALQVAEIEAHALVGDRRGGDDPRRRRGDELVAQRFGQHEIGHVVEGEGELEALGRHPPVGEEGAGVVDQHVDARLARGDRLSDLARFRHAREIRQMQAMAEPGRFRLELAHRRFARELRRAR